MEILSDILSCLFELGDSYRSYFLKISWWSAFPSTGIVGFRAFSSSSFVKLLYYCLYGNISCHFPFMEIVTVFPGVLDSWPSLKSVFGRRKLMRLGRSFLCDIFSYDACCIACIHVGKYHDYLSVLLRWWTRAERICSCDKNGRALQS